MRKSKFEIRMENMRKGRIFRPITFPRYLPGSVTKATIDNDLKTYNRHRFNCFYAEPVVDDHPPPMNPNNYVDQTRLRADAVRLTQIDQENKELLKKINYINRIGGRIDSFNPKAYDRASNWETHKSKMLEICKENIVLYKRLLATQANYSRTYFKDEWEKNLDKIKHMSKFTLQYYLTKSIDQKVREMPSISCGLDIEFGKNRKPICYLDFMIKDGIPLGRILIQLYADVAPETCKNFMMLCRGTKGIMYKNTKVYNVVKGRYMEAGDVTTNNGKGGCSIFGEKFKSEQLILKHTRPGVVSMVPVDKEYNNSKFSITFDVQEHLDKKRVVFGKVVKGMKTVFHIQDLGRKVGAPIVPIIIAKCGVKKMPKGHKKVVFTDEKETEKNYE